MDKEMVQENDEFCGKEQDMIMERYELTIGRIRELAEKPEIEAPFEDYFKQMAFFLLKMDGLYKWIENGYYKEEKEEGLAIWNQDLYSDILPEHYEESYANPEYAVKMLGDTYGRILSFLYAELRCEIVYAYEQRLFDMTIRNELFLEVYSLMKEEPSYRHIKEAIYWFFSDYCEVTLKERIGEQLDPKKDFAVRIIMDSDLSDLSYLYRYGEYITENEKKMAEYLNSLPQEEIDAMAFTYTDGFREGFALAGIDLTKKKLVNIRYSVGMERMVRAAILQFRELGLEPVIYRGAVSSIHKKNSGRIGYFSTSPNRQYEYDHRFDNTVYLDKAFVDRKLTHLKIAYECYREEASVFAGPACIETFGEKPFMPVNKTDAYHLTEKQQKLNVEYAGEAGKIVDSYINPAERSFAIIAYPIPEIGDNFEEIFGEIVKVNTLDKNMYREIQQKLIDVLDRAEYAHIKGSGTNETDLTVALTELKNPEKETLFENCLADVNIPVGEVFTSPKLSGTNGVLHVSGVYLNGLYYENLKLTFKDGKIQDYSCTNFEEEEKNRDYIKENILYHHETLPMGEFAIGTNTTAYQLARDYKIEAKLPILIAEKMGPHFAVGDTCYCHAEENTVYNPDGKEIIAKENECSLLRNTDPYAAYFNCHTDITIPYDELERIHTIEKDGTEVTLIENGRFVLAGTEELNKAFR